MTGIIKDQAEQMLDKVLYYKGRVWTVYAVSGGYDGIFAYQGLKPYDTFKYDPYISKRNISYLDMADAMQNVVDDKYLIHEYLKAERKAESKKLTKGMAAEFLANLTGHSKSKILSLIDDRYNGFIVLLGSVRYDLFKMDDRMILHHNIHGHTSGTTFDFVTWKHDSLYNDKSSREEKKEIIDAYKEQYDCRCDKKTSS